MERDRKSYTDESQNVIRKQRCVKQLAPPRRPFAPLLSHTVQRTKSRQAGDDSFS
jgi:hypothetical protein